MVTANDGPLSPVLVHLLSIIRALPFASHGLVKDPGPVDPAGQSCWGSAALDAAAAGALAEDAGADADGVAAALALAEGTDAGELSSLEQPARVRIATVVVEDRLSHPGHPRSASTILEHEKRPSCSLISPRPRRAPSAHDDARSDVLVEGSALPRSLRSRASHPIAPAARTTLLRKVATRNGSLRRAKHDGRRQAMGGRLVAQR